MTARPSIPWTTELPTPLVMSEISPGAHVELYNATDSDIDLSAANYWLCSPFNYSALAGTGVTVPAGGYATVPFPINFNDTEQGGEIILYRDVTIPQQFADGTRIVDLVCWGVNPHASRKPLAESVGKWSGPCAAGMGAGAIHRLPQTMGTTTVDYDVSAPPDPQDCVPGGGSPADINQDGAVDVVDLVAVILAWGPCPDPPAPCPDDVDEDGQVGVLDLIQVILAWTG